MWLVKPGHLEVVSADAPVAVVVLCRPDRGVAGDLGAVDEQGHAVGAEGGHDVVPVAVVVGVRAGDGPHSAGVHAERSRPSFCM